MVEKNVFPHIYLYSKALYLCKNCREKTELSIGKLEDMVDVIYDEIFQQYFFFRLTLYFEQ